MSVLSALGFTFISLIFGAYIVSAIRPSHTHDRDEHEDIL